MTAAQESGSPTWDALEQLHTAEPAHDIFFNSYAGELALKLVNDHNIIGQPAQEAFQWLRDGQRSR